MAEINCCEQAVITVATELTDVEPTSSNVTDNPQKDAGEANQSININALPDWPLLWEDARKVRKDLDEPDEKDRLITFARLLGVLGGQVVRHLVNKAQEIYQGEGMLVADGSRKRTLGGIFFLLAKVKVDPKLWLRISPFRERKDILSPSSQPKSLTEEELKQIKQAFWQQVKQANQWEKGEVTTVKITITGRPGKIEKANNYISFTMESKPPSSLPKGLPELTAPTTYLLMVALKQWKKIESALAANPEDIIIAEGHSTIVPTFRGIAVLVKSITTKEQQKQLKLANQEKANTINLAP